MEFVGVKIDSINKENLSYVGDITFSGDYFDLLDYLAHLKEEQILINKYKLEGDAHDLLVKLQLK